MLLLIKQWTMTCLLLIASVLGGVKAQDVLVVTEYLAPFQIKNEDGSLGGFATEIVERLFDITNDIPHYNVLPWVRAYRVALTKPNILVFSLAKTQERNDKFQWVGKVKAERFFIWGLRSQFSKRFDSVEQAKHYRVGTSKSYSSAIYLANNGFTNIYYTSQDRQTIGMLYKKRIEILVSSELVLQKLAEKHGHDFSQLIKLANVTELNNDLSIAFSQGSDTGLIKRFRLAYQYLEQSGELAALGKKWQVFDDPPLQPSNAPAY